MTTPEKISLIVGLSGAFVGLMAFIVALFAYLRERRRDRPRLRVVPKIGRNVPGISTGIISGDKLLPGMNLVNSFLGIEIINLSCFPITVEHVGFGSPNTNMRPVLFNQNLLPFSDKIPKRLESRELMTLWTADIFEPEIIKEIQVYVKTSCGYVAYGSNKILVEYVKENWKRSRNNIESTS